MSGRKSLVKKAMKDGDIIINIDPRINRGKNRLKYSDVKKMDSRFLSLNKLDVNILDHRLCIVREYNEKNYIIRLYNKSHIKVIEREIEKESTPEEILQEMYISVRGH